MRDVQVTSEIFLINGSGVRTQKEVFLKHISESKKVFKIYSVPFTYFLSIWQERADRSPP